MSRLQKRIRQVAEQALRVAALVVILLAAFSATTPMHAQGSRKDDVVFNAQGRPMAGATVRVCTSTATGQPCAPLAQIYSDPGLTQALANPTATDGLGNYTFYAAPGRYEIEISGPNITTKQLPNVVLPSDPMSPTFTTVTTTGGVSAFSLSLAGNLTVSGSAAVTGALTVGGSQVPSASQDIQWSAAQRFKGPIPWRDVTAYMPNGGCSSTSAGTTGTISGSSTTLTLAAAKDFKNGCGIAVVGAGPLPTLTAPVTSLTVTGATSSGNVVTLTVTSVGWGSGSPSGFNEGIQVSGCANSAYNGTFPVQSYTNTLITYNTSSSGTGSTSGCAATMGFGYAHGITGSTTYNYCVAMMDASGGITPCSGTITITNGNATLNKYNYNHIMWNTTSFPQAHVLVYSDKGLGGTKTCIGESFSFGFSDQGYNYPCPSWAPANAPASAVAEFLNTTIVSGGGTTTLTLAAAATTSVSNTTVDHDESSFWYNCVNDTINDQKFAGNNSTGSYGCYWPAGNWYINGPTPLQTLNPNANGSGMIRNRIAGTMNFSALPLVVNYNAYTLEGMGGGQVAQQFTYEPVTQMGFGSDYGIVVTNTLNVKISGFSISSLVTPILALGYGSPMPFLQNLVLFPGNHGAAIQAEQAIGGHFEHITVLEIDSGGEANFKFTSWPYSGLNSCCVTMTDIFSDVHGIETSTPGGTNSGGAYSDFSVRNWLIENLDPKDNGLWQHDNGPNAPGTQGGVGLSYVDLTNVDDADVAQQFNNPFVLEGTGGGTQISHITLNNVPGQQVVACVNQITACWNGSSAIPDLGVFGSGPAYYSYDKNGQGFAALGPASGNTNLSFNTLATLSTGYCNPGCPGFTMQMPAPTINGASTTGAGSLAIGNYCYGLTSLDSHTGSIGETNLSNGQCATVGASSGITIPFNEGWNLTQIGNMTGAASSFNFYWCTYTSPATYCDPNYAANTQKLTGITTSVVGSYRTFAFTSTSGASGNKPPLNNGALLSWLNFDQSNAPYSCFFCVNSSSDRWPVGFGIVPAANVGANIQTAKGIKTNPVTFSNLPACGSTVEGVMEAVTDSTTSTWGATITGGGSNHVLAYCDGTNWTVAAK